MQAAAEAEEEAADDDADEPEDDEEVEDDEVHHADLSYNAIYRHCSWPAVCSCQMLVKLAQCNGVGTCLLLCVMAGASVVCDLTYKNHPPEIVVILLG